MPKFAANLSFLFTDVPFPERFKKAAAAGFTGVEYMFPYDYPPHDVAEWLRDNDLEQVLFNVAPGDWTAGERGLACLPHRQGEFAEGVEQAL
ncbi:MAG TPA: hydroxypyruvate isomerase, partial [Azonexus sp.]|nr:hydroxypyruvate isomerase [Azonexus sp.]